MPLPVSAPLAGKIAATAVTAASALGPVGWAILAISGAVAVKIASKEAPLKSLSLKAGPFNLNAGF